MERYFLKKKKKRTKALISVLLKTLKYLFTRIWATKQGDKSRRHRIK